MGNDLISREALRERIQRYMSNSWIMPCNEVLKRIDNAPAVEINTDDIEYKAYCRGLEDDKKIAINRGEWIEQKNYPFCYECSQCGTENTHKTNFCSYCGAGMKEE